MKAQGIKKQKANRKNPRKKNKLTTEMIYANTGFLKKDGVSLLKALMEEKKRETNN